MEVQLIIDGSFDEIQEVFRLLAAGHEPEAILESFEPIHHPHEPVCQKTPPPASGIMLTPMGPMPIVETPPADLFQEKEGENQCHDEKVKQSLKLENKVCPGCSQPFTPKISFQNYCSSKCYQKKYFSDHNVKKNKPVNNEKEPVDLQIHCHQCGTPFHPKKAGMKFCSKRCYMIEWREVHKKPVFAVKSYREIEQDVITAHKIPSSLKEKLDKIKATCPAPTKRPEFARNLL